MTEIGIEALNAYCGLARLPLTALFSGRGLDPARIPNLLMDSRSVLLPWEDPVTNAVHAAGPVVGRLDADDVARIELVITATESGVDLSKSLAGYVHRYLGLSRRCRILEVKQACYGLTAALQLAAAHLAARPGSGAKALVIGTDISPMDAAAGYAEPTMGNGAVAMLLSDRPRILTLERGASGLHGFETLDTARPAPDLDVVDPDLSLLTYLECLSGSLRDYARQVPGTDFRGDFDYLIMHTPFPGMVRAAHRRLMRDAGTGRPAVVEDDFRRRVLPSLRYAQTVGNLCAGSLYLALASLISHVPAAGAEGRRIGLYSYGSGCASEFFAGTVPAGAAAALAGMGIGDSIRARRDVTFAEYEELLPAARACLVPVADRKTDLSRLGDFPGSRLIFTGVENHHRRYEWT
ncbi:putative 3-hydroxy-3-methylglutaryl-CoA synthase [Actinoplanes missouriensis 431]|uniref:Putative 3-hydroxy-3-methylglutaryl-CoA synthase n=1 Tax=Actinoplanes missouriensis (strain ATCC 14538 / DSM 43046 / CBS 188.64 / JCM 3121 / NBRC 102363 / NCIMB 12654 / NRRL B-3342 / UNCC 431) TaxID=512565 RepID=I0HB71_ACTM4|nr:hydroxymethylglutaryl-CoA synthase [Actinoplanes missouriensis]BAL90258.1 putative 3-hydroxy-3-methylglutaryl-CoA synthase [Actinoplanes missouriensis 431]